jgi:phosphoadenosine phosphosulfate reductase
MTVMAVVKKGVAMENKVVKKYQTTFKNSTAEDILRNFFSIYSGSPAPGKPKNAKDRIALASSLGAEDQVLTHMALALHPTARVFILDTGRFHGETYDLIAATMKQYGMHYEILFPETADVEELESVHGPNSFYESIEQRKYCCHVRKVKPLQRVLSTLDVWITGLRRGQAVTRNTIEKIEWDDSNGIIKLNPIADWSEEQVWNYIHENHISYNKLHDQGYPSIGCAPCTRAVSQGENLRAGRWWWETPDQKECGLHISNGKLNRRNK